MKKTSPLALTVNRETIAGSEIFLTPPEIAKLLRVSSEKVFGWIRRGELQAINVGDGLRPRYRVKRDSFNHFVKSLEVQPPARRVTKHRRAPDGGPIDPVLGEKLLNKNQAVRFGDTYYRVRDGVILFY